MKQRHPKHLIQGSREHLCFSEEAGVKFSAWFSLPPYILSGDHIRHLRCSVNIGLCDSHSWSIWESWMEKSCWNWVTPSGWSSLTDGTVTFSKCAYIECHLGAVLYNRLSESFHQKKVLFADQIVCSRILTQNFKSQCHWTTTNGK
jgi:hypothetical protein